ncbi:hypothetical protein [Azospirillum thermophilum]|uniref:Uncharacterized protein n=1 Tax=Azospirillum thermophilum TaxID=2202148 RepID=A0A2S2CM39_9PROT|nr:hypothetical protein [Azospirillum thermophilum]AWK85541.1 hypothetical protein DEW08_04595 [Azospirillum thermophilum]
MSSTTTRPPEPETGPSPLDVEPCGRAAGGGRRPLGRPFPEPAVEKIRGPKLAALWLTLMAAAWAVMIGAGYGFYVLVSGSLL